MFLSLIVDMIGRWEQAGLVGVGPNRAQCVLLLSSPMCSREKIAAILLERAAASGDPYIRLARPCCCVKWRAGRPFVFNVSFGVFQFVGVRLILAVIVPITEALGVYEEVSGCFRTPRIFHHALSWFSRRRHPEQGIYGLKNSFGWSTITILFSQVHSGFVRSGSRANTSCVPVCSSGRSIA